MFAMGRFCCKSLLASLVANFPSRRRDFRINMLGTSSPDETLTGDFAIELETISIGDWGSFHLLAGNLSLGISGLLQHNLPISHISLNGFEQTTLNGPDGMLVHRRSLRQRGRRSWSTSRSRPRGEFGPE